MKKMKTSFLDNYKNKISDISENNLEEAVYYAFDLTDQYGIVKINKAISEIEETLATEKDTYDCGVEEDRNVQGWIEALEYVLRIMK